MQWNYFAYSKEQIVGIDKMVVPASSGNQPLEVEGSREAPMVMVLCRLKTFQLPSTNRGGG